MSNPRNLPAVLLNAIPPPSLTSYPSNNINEGPGPPLPLVVGWVTAIIGGPLRSHPLCLPGAGINVIHRQGQKSNQTYVQQIRVCVFSCHHYFAGLLEYLMRFSVKGSPSGRMKALKCL